MFSDLVLQTYDAVQAQEHASKATQVVTSNGQSDRQQKIGSWMRRASGTRFPFGRCLDVALNQKTPA